MTERLKILLEDFHYGEVKMQDSYRKDALTLELNYLRSLDPDRLLAGFYEVAGLKAKAERYGGWEVTEIQGHTLGHYLKAISQAYAYTQERELLERAEYLISGLKECQREDGYLFAGKEEIFDRVENKKPAWVPWYTMHKILSGIISVHVLTGHEGARQVAINLGAWIYRRCIGWTDELQKTVLAVEYGGMNDCLYELYGITGDERFAKAAHQFDEIPLFQNLYENKDVLNGLHANTTIPKILGALKRYIVWDDNEDFYLKAVENFWDMVVEHHSYVTGGNSEWEHFGKPDILDSERTACNCETCNTYNMLKLSKALFEVTKKRKYADYYSNTVLNAILSSQHPETGMTMYFQPMATGYFKVYSTPYESFWCCTGSGMENFTKLSEGIAYRDEENMYITRYEDCELDWRTAGLKMQIRCTEVDHIFKVQIEILEESGDLEGHEVRLLIPKWSKSDVKVSSEGVITDLGEDWIALRRGLKKGNTVTVEYSMELQCHELPDNPKAMGFTYGPYVLSAGLGVEKMDTDYTGVDVLVPKREMIISDYIELEDATLEEFRDHPEDYLVKEDGKIAFHLKNEELIFTPHFSKYKERYGIYWLIYEKGSKELTELAARTERRYLLEKEQIDVIPVGNDQYELAHRVRGEKTDSKYMNGHPCRYCEEEGWFSYEMKAGEGSMSLCVTLSKADAGNVFTLSLGDNHSEEIEVQNCDQEFYVTEIKIPEKCIGGNNTVNVRFHSKEGVCRIFDELYLKKSEE